MNLYLTSILDFLFPPTAEARELRLLSPDDLFSKLPPAPPSPLPFITSLFAYKDPLVAELVKSIKNKKDGHALRLAGAALLEKVPSEALLIPIPLSKKRRNARGYNQCELLIDEILKLDSDKKLQRNFDILRRARHTEEQKLKNRTERLENKNIFTVEYTPINVPIILIDDVATTGSTLKEARDALLRAGYADVAALTLAH